MANDRHSNVMLSDVQRSIKQGYGSDSGIPTVTFTTWASMPDDGVYTCSVERAKEIRETRDHAAVGRAGITAGSGEVLPGALAAYAQLPSQIVAGGMGMALNDVQAEGYWGLWGTMGLSCVVPGDFQ